MILNAAAALVIVETTWVAYGQGLASEAAIGLAIQIIDNFALTGCDKMKEAWNKRHETQGTDSPVDNPKQ